MPIKSYLGSDFHFEHEQIAFDNIENLLKEKWADSDELILFLGNFYAQSHQIDCLILKSNAIILIELKNYRGKLNISANGEWFIEDSIKIKASSFRNPFLQIKSYRDDLITFLQNKEKVILDKNKTIKWRHTSASVLFTDVISLDQNEFKSIFSRNAWFNIWGINNICDQVQYKRSPSISLSNGEMERIPMILGLEERITQGPKIKGDNFTNIKDLHYSLCELSNALYAKDFCIKGIEHSLEMNKVFNEFYNRDDYIISKILDYHSRSRTNSLIEFFENLKVDISNKIKIHKNICLELFKVFINELSLPISDKSLENYEEIELIISLLTEYNSDLILVKPINSYLYIIASKFLYDYGIWPEEIMRELAIDLSSNKSLLQYLSGLYEILRIWFAEDIIQHYQEIENGRDNHPERIEHIKAAGFSKEWLLNINNVFNSNNHLEMENNDILDNIVVPQKLKNTLKKLLTGLNGKLSPEDFKLFNNLLRLDWINNESLSEDDIVLFELRSHLTFSFSKDKEFLGNGLPDLPNSLILEPVYIKILGTMINWSEDENWFLTNYSNSYKSLDDIELKNEILDTYKLWRFYKPKYFNDKKSNYPNNNGINLGTAPNGTPYEAFGDTWGRNVVKELKIDLKTVKEFLSKAKNNNLRSCYNPYKHHSIGDVAYIQLLNKYKNYKESFFKQPSPKTSISRTAQILKKDFTLTAYSDVREKIEEHLIIFKNPALADDFGLPKPNGILLYGPPGCGKTYFANWIASYLNYKLFEIPRSIFGSTYVDGAMNNLMEILNKAKKETPAIVFFDEFDSVAYSRSKSGEINLESKKVVNTLLQEIPKLSANNVIVVAATNLVNDLDEAVIRPGRFDLKIPIFPPKPNERLTILMDKLLRDKPKAWLEILSQNGANNFKYWRDKDLNMKLFTNSHIVMFVDRLKSKVFAKKISGEKFNLLTKEMIKEVLKEVKSQITPVDVDGLKSFLEETKKFLLDSYPDRIDWLEKEILEYNPPKKKIGFT